MSGARIALTVAAAGSVPVVAAGLRAVRPAPVQARVRRDLVARRARPWPGERAGPALVAGLGAVLGDRVDPARLGRWWAGALLAGPLVAAITVGPAIGVVVAVAIALAPKVAGRVADQRDGARLDRQVPDALARVAGALRAGSSLATALDEAARATPAPLGPQLGRVVDEAAQGRPVAEVLRGWAAAAPPASTGVRLAGTALALGAEAGGGVARAVDGVAATIRERHQLRAEAATLATQAQASAVLIGVAPIGFAALLAATDPAAARFLLTTPLGAACLLGGLGLEAAGVAWMRRITRSIG